MTALTVAQIEPWLATPSDAQALSELLLLWTVVIYITFGNKPAVLAAIASTYLFAVCAGAHIVRGALAKGGSLPTHARRIVDAPTKMVVDTPTAIPAGRRDADAPVGALDSVEYNRGRLIGMIERMLLITLVAAGSFDALAFIIAAKSLIRSKELEHRDFAEYFLIGTLTSVALALPLGLLVQKLIKHW